MLITKNNSGFTLVEMAIVLLIVGLLLGGLIPTLSAQMETQRINETRKQMDEVQQALIGFVLANGRLPCPADPSIATGQTGAGVERTPPCTNGNSTGALPWATLGVNETDAWGNRYTYRVTASYADKTDGATGSCAITAGISFQLCSTANLDILSASGGNTIAASVPALIISHGKNGAGAYTPRGIQMAISSDADEQENSDGSTDNNYVSKTPTPGYDDIVIWISPNILLNRMVAAGKLP